MGRGQQDFGFFGGRAIFVNFCIFSKKTHYFKGYFSKFFVDGTAGNLV